MSKVGFFDIFSEIGHYKFLIFFHDGRGQYVVSFECRATFGKNLNPAIKGD